jgi:hypothetical protein
VVSVIPHNHHVNADHSDKCFFVWEKMGLDMALLSRPGDIGGEDDEGIDENPH